MAKLTIEFEFSEEKDEDFTEDLSFFNLDSLKAISSDLTEDQMREIAEVWAQSDRYWVGTCSAIISALDSPGKSIEGDDFIS